MFLGYYQALLASALLVPVLRSTSISALVIQDEPLLLAPPASLHDERETLSEAAVHARELIQYRSQGIGTLMSTYPQDHPDESLRGLSIGLQEYFTPFPNGDLLLLALPISMIYQNINHTRDHSATIAIKDELGSVQRDGALWAANRRRVSLFGTLHVLKESELEQAKELYESFHPDASFWDGENGPHRSIWVRFKITKVFYFGGFGDRAAIGWLDIQLYRNNFKDSIENKNRSICFHSKGLNLYCDQPKEEL